MGVYLDCKHCSGVGRLDVECNSCGGTGKRFDGSKCPYCQWGRKSVECLVCRGQKKLRDPDSTMVA